MVQKNPHRAATANRGCGAARSISTCGGGSLRRCALHRTALVSASLGPKAEACRSERSLLGSAANATYGSILRAGRFDDPPSSQGRQPLGGVWCCGHSTRNGGDGITPLLSLSTIGRILRRHGVLDGRRRFRRPPPPRGWYLPVVAAAKAELDSFDTIEGLAIRGGPHVSVLTGISLHGGLPATWTLRAVSAKMVVNALVEHWRSVGLPAYAQFDNDNRFRGPRQHADAIGRVIRLCLSLDVTPVSAPPNETGFQAGIESYNGRWQAKVWSRFKHSSIRGLSRQSAKYIAAARIAAWRRIEAAPRRHLFPRRWHLDLQRARAG